MQARAKIHRPIRIVLIPVSAILLGVLILGEQLAPRHFLGMAAIALGLATIDGRLLSRAHARKSLPPRLPSSR